MPIKSLLKDIISPITQSRPSFMIIGAQKGGTTSLYNYLVEHPQIIGNRSWKEIRYYDLPSNYEQGFSWYLRMFPSKSEKGDRLTFDASPSYLYFPEIPQKIKNDFGEIKLIAVLRNPVQRAYFAWKMYHSFGLNDEVSANNKAIADNRSFKEAIEQELMQSCAPDIYPYDYVSRGLYAEQLERYFSCFNRESLLVIESTELQKKTQEILNIVCKFLGIDSFDDKQITTILEKQYNVGVESQKSTEDQEMINKLTDYFTPHNQWLFELLGREFDW